MVAWIFYLSLPLTYFYVMAHLVPEVGLDDAKINQNFGFLWSRFEPRAYWWEAVDLIRKVGLVVVSMVIQEPSIQAAAGAICVGIVMSANFLVTPFIRDLYDYFDAFGCVLEVIEASPSSCVPLSLSA